jgi:hypothetical protein
MEGALLPEPSISNTFSKKRIQAARPDERESDHGSCKAEECNLIAVSQIAVLQTLYRYDEDYMQ